MNVNTPYVSAPLVSVVMPFYKSSAFIEATLHSILNQTMRDFEVILVDDGGEDGSRALVRKFTDPRIRLLVNQGNRGISYSTNRAIKEARGMYIAIWDSDDLCHPERLGAQVAFMQDHENAVLIGTSAYHLSEDNRLLSLHRQPRSDLAIRFQMLFNPPFYHPSCMMRRSTMMQHGILYNESIQTSIDYDLWCRLAQHGGLANIDAPLLLYRKHPTSISRREGGVQHTEKVNTALEQISKLRPFTDESRVELVRLLEALYGVTPPLKDMPALGRTLAIVLADFCRAYGVGRSPMALRAMLGRWQLKWIVRSGEGVIARTKALVKWLLSRHGFALELLLCIPEELRWRIMRRIERRAFIAACALKQEQVTVSFPDGSGARATAE